VKGTKRYQVVVHQHVDYFELECNCPAFDWYDEECKHVVAVMLEIQERIANEGNVPTQENMLQARQRERERKQEELVR
ncbi:SWIM zinc finger family protein, partial [Alkalihalophilus pseudofirmus]